MLFLSLSIVSAQRANADTSSVTDRFLDPITRSYDSISTNVWNFITNNEQDCAQIHQEIAGLVSAYQQQFAVVNPTTLTNGITNARNNAYAAWAAVWQDGQGGIAIGYKDSAGNPYTWTWHPFPGYWQANYLPSVGEANGLLEGIARYRAGATNGGVFTQFESDLNRFVSAEQASSDAANNNGKKLAEWYNFSTGANEKITDLSATASAKHCVQ
jgi:hypothetical protein